LVRAGASGEENLLRRARSVLLEHVSQRAPGNVATGARLMGVTEPTFRRWVGQAQIELELAG
jgi:hypothetical protein